jgi:hypothetical protein
MTDLYDLAVTAETLREDIDRFVLAQQRLVIAAQVVCDAFNDGTLDAGLVGLLRDALTETATP